MDKLVQLIAYLAKFEWMKGWRTMAIVAVVVGGYVAERFLGLDVPGFDFTIENVLLALGLGTAAAHEAK